MKKYKIIVNFISKKIFPETIELVKNDYNSTTLNFNFDIEASTYLFKLKFPDNTEWINDVKENQITLEKGVLSQSGIYQYEIAAYGEDKRLTAIAIGKLNVRNELISTDEIVEVDDRIPVLDSLINQVDAINIDVEKSDNIAKVTLISKDGVRKEVEIYDGEKGEQGIQGPQGIQGERGEQGIQGPVGPQGERGIQGLKGDKGDKGETGIQGIQGPQGIRGEKGDKGDKGDVGPQGIQGERGPEGPRGIQGPKGEDGITPDVSNLSDIDLSNITETAEQKIKDLAGGSGKNVYLLQPTSQIPQYYDNSPVSYRFTGNDLLIFQNLINQLKEDGITDLRNIILKSTWAGGILLVSNDNNINSTYFDFKAMMKTVDNRYDKILNNRYTSGQLVINGTWNDGIFKATSVTFFTGAFGLLATNNEYAYTPTQNYHPSTKKYVDDAIKTAIGDINTQLASLTTMPEEGE